MICDDFVAKTTDMMENARGNQRPQVPIERLARGGWTVFLYLILVVLTILWVYVILSRLMGRRDICSEKNYDKMSFREDFFAKMRVILPQIYKKKKGTTAVAYFSYRTLCQRCE